MPPRTIDSEPRHPSSVSGPAMLRGRDALRSIAALIGVSVTVTDRDEWTLDEHGLHIGYGWHLSRGYPIDEAQALTLLELWIGARWPRVAPARMRRARGYGRSRSELQVLIDGIQRAQAATEIVRAFPGLRGSLAAAFTRGLPRDVESELLHLQWVALVLMTGANLAVAGVGCDPRVRAEWERAQRFGGASGDAVRRVLDGSSGGADELTAFEHALALLAPPFERLLAADRASRGLGVEGAEAQPHEGGSSDDDSGAAGSDDGAGGADDRNDPDDDHDDDGGPEGVADGDDPERARPGDAPEHAEGSDLFQAEQAGSVNAFLDTPLPASGELQAALEELAADARDSDQPATPPVSSGAGAIGTGASSYARRIEQLSPDIEAMRDVWSRVIAERVARVSGFSRLPHDEGDELDASALAQGLADASAGVERPRVFTRRETRVRRANRPGNTDYLLLVDRSSSMQGAPTQAALDAAIIMLEGLAAASRDIANEEEALGLDLELQLRTGFIVYDAAAHTVKPLSRNVDDESRAALYAALGQPYGSTNDAAALDAAAAEFRRTASSRERRRMVFVVSDGGTNDRIAAQHALRRLRSLGVQVYGIGIATDDVSARYSPRGVRIESAADLPDEIARIIEAELP